MRIACSPEIFEELTPVRHLYETEIQNLNSFGFFRQVKNFDLILDQKNLVLKFLEDNNICVLYKFFFKKRGVIETIGFIITDKHKQNIELFGARTKKRIEALNSICKIISSK